MKITAPYRALTCLLLSIAGHATAASDFTITPKLIGSTLRWSVNIGTETARTNPTLYLARGQIYAFTVNTSTSHPFYFKTKSGATSANAYDNGVSHALPVTSGTPFTFDVPDDAPDTLFYNCGVHNTMAGMINVVVFRSGFD